MIPPYEDIFVKRKRCYMVPRKINKLRLENFGLGEKIFKLKPLSHYTALNAVGSPDN